MRKIATIITIIVLTTFTAFAQFESANVWDDLLNPTDQERAMYANMSLYQIKEEIALTDAAKLMNQLRSLNNEIQGLETELTQVSNLRATSEIKTDSIRTMVINQIQVQRLRANIYTIIEEPEKGLTLLKDAEAKLEEIEKDSKVCSQLRSLYLDADFAINKIAMSPEGECSERKLECEIAK